MKQPSLECHSVFGFSTPFFPPTTQLPVLIRVPWSRRHVGMMEALKWTQGMVS